ncbi:hypothetical protein ACJRO7_031301 [Eucalyptus globulus]|uniref:Uncharacterized protein n=1 Tax=Eucalyptus globulus TaxID=34317 RepID=A0ABD3JJE1_EUCGL
MGSNLYLQVGKVGKPVSLGECQGPCPMDPGKRWHPSCTCRPRPKTEARSAWTWVPTTPWWSRPASAWAATTLAIWQASGSSWPTPIDSGKASSKLGGTFIAKKKA